MIRSLQTYVSDSVTFANNQEPDETPINSASNQAPDCFTVKFYVTVCCTTNIKITSDRSGSNRKKGKYNKLQY